MATGEPGSHSDPDLARVLAGLAAVLEDIVAREFTDGAPRLGSLTEYFGVAVDLALRDQRSAHIASGIDLLGSIAGYLRQASAAVARSTAKGTCAIGCPPDEPRPYYEIDDGTGGRLTVCDHLPPHVSSV